MPRENEIDHAFQRRDKPSSGEKRQLEVSATTEAYVEFAYRRGVVESSITAPDVFKGFFHRSIFHRGAALSIDDLNMVDMNFLICFSE